VNPVPDIFSLTTAVLAVSAISLTGFGLRRERYRGWAWWVTSMWLATLGALLAAASDAAAARTLAGLLLMQWPIVTLVGVRRFHARQVLAGDARLDGILLVVALAITLAAAVYGEPLAGRVGSGCAFALHLYAALLLFRGPGGREGAPVQALALTLALAAFAPVLGMAPGGELAAPLALRAAAAALAALSATVVEGAIPPDLLERRACSTSPVCCPARSPPSTSPTWAPT